MRRTELPLPAADLKKTAMCQPVITSHQGNILRINYLI